MKYFDVKGLTVPVSQLAFGTATSTLEDEAIIHDMLDYYVSVGGNYVDTARFYGRGSGIQHTEEILGRWLNKNNNREKVVVESKCCNPYMDRHLHCHNDLFRVGKAYMYDDVLFSMDHLAVDTIDIYLTHRDDPNVPVAEIMDTFQDFILRGWIKAYGMSNWRLDRIIEAYEYCERMAYQGPSVVSPFFSLVKLEQPWYYRIPPFKEEWLDWFREHQDVLISAWSPQGRGFFGNYPQYLPENADADTKRAVLNPTNFARKERVLELAKEKGIGPSQISLAYVLNQGFPTVGIFGPRSTTDIDKALAAANIVLTKEEIDYLTLKIDR